MISFISSIIRLKILPLTIFFSISLLGIKTYDIINGTSKIADMILIKTAVAATPNPENPTGESKDSSNDSVNNLGDKKTTGDGKKQTEDKPDNKDNNNFSEIEVDLLQRLSERRNELDGWEKEIQMKENLMKATEYRINERLDEVKNLEKTVQELLKEYKKKEDANIRSLVKIYENMKPKNAARIFDELEMQILFAVVDKMSERKAAPILAKMNPLKAKSLTVELAENKKMRDIAEDSLKGK